MESKRELKGLLEVGGGYSPRTIARASYRYSTKRQRFFGQKLRASPSPRGAQTKRLAGGERKTKGKHTPCLSHGGLKAGHYRSNRRQARTRA